MDFYNKYDLIEGLPGGSSRSFRARQIRSGRDVTVHLLVGGRTPENEKLLARLREMPAQSFSKLLEVGDNEGTLFVVTAAPPYLGLNEWLEEQEKAAGNVNRPASDSVWSAPVAAPPSPAPPPPPQAPPAAAAAEHVPTAFHCQ